MRWNLSSRARELSGGDAILISIPKSGRTWVRTFLNAYFSYKLGRQFSLDLTDRGDTGVPRIIYSHDRFEDRTKGTAWDRLRRKYLIPRRALRKRPIVLLARDPRDAFVSYFIQLTRRNPATPTEIMAARPRDVLRLVLSSGLSLVALGVTAGLAAAFAATRFLGALMFGVSPVDPPTFAAAAAILIIVALLAHWVPIRRALRIDPAMALRAE